VARALVGRQEWPGLKRDVMFGFFLRCCEEALDVPANG
jgi:hypothetical protein